MPSMKTWNLDKLATTICIALLSKFDFFIVVEGNRGLGKSTLAYHLSRKVANKLRKYKSQIGLPRTAYTFKPERDLLYKREKVIQFVNTWNSIGVADELINVSFSRDFWQEDQKNLIKLMNMNRDHCNLFIACVPRFQTIDNQLKNLCKMRITVVRRGLAIIQSPNRSIYSTDIWDSRANEKTERDWVTKGVKNPRYTRLSTFRGIMRFSKLSDEDENLYVKIKTEQRNLIAQDEMNLGEKKKDDPFEQLIGKLVKTGIKNMQVIDGYAMALGTTPNALQNRIRTRLQGDGRNNKLSDYFWDNMKRKGISQDEKDRTKELIKSI